MKKQMLLAVGLVCCVFMLMGCEELLNDLLGGGNESESEETHDGEQNDNGDDPAEPQLVDCPNAASFERADCQVSFVVEHESTTRGCFWKTNRISEPGQKRFGFRIEGAVNSANPGVNGILELTQITDDGTEIILDQIDTADPREGAPWVYASSRSGSGQCSSHGCGDGHYLIYLNKTPVSDCSEYDIDFFVVLGP